MIMMMRIYINFMHGKRNGKNTLAEPCLCGVIISQKMFYLIYGKNSSFKSNCQLRLLKPLSTNKFVITCLLIRARVHSL